MGLLDITLINIERPIAHPPVLVILLNKEKKQQFDLMGIKEGKTIVNMDSIMLRRWRPQGSLSAWLGSLSKQCDLTANLTGTQCLHLKNGAIGLNAWKDLALKVI